jgi:uncharacterized repeat protein (TIGR01451 family)
MLAVLALAPRLALAVPDLSLQMSAVNPVPTPGQPVEFKVTLSNVGTDAANDVRVIDKLPAELAIPAGLAAFPSTGTYDPDAGVWLVGTLNAGASATLVIPAVFAVPNPPACSVNVAETNHVLDTRRSNNRALAAARTSSSERCVNLGVAATRTSYLDCGSSMRLSYSVSVSNAGPDDASNVFLDLSQDPAIAPNLHFTGAGCSGTRCTIESLAAGVTYFAEATSDAFANNRNRSVMLVFSTSSSDTDYSTSNNQLAVDRDLPALGKCPDYEGDWLIAAGGSGCFIATAAYGSPLEPHVMALREFRDRYLQRTRLGRAFVRFYYRHSPAVAAVIARHESLRTGMRALLTPLVLAIEFPARSLALVMLALTALFATLAHRRCDHA